MRGRLQAWIGAALAVLVLCTPVEGSSGAAQARDNTLQKTVKALVAAGAPGAVAAVRTSTATRRAVAGVAILRPRTRMRTTDRYRIASVTKPFVATLVLKLAAERRLTLGDTVERWLPGLIPNGQAISLRQLLNHTSGLYDYGSDRAWQQARLENPRREWSPRELVAIATSHPALFAPGRGWSYSNTNYVLAGLVVEAVTGKPLVQELQDRLFAPLALRSTSYPAGTEIEGRHAHGYVGRGSGLPIAKGTLVDVTTVVSPTAWGAGQIVSNADDLTRCFQALLRGRLLPAAELRAMKTVVPGYAYGLGIRRASTACGTAWGHNGDIPGYRNVVWATADGRRSAAVMVNVDTTHVSWDRLEGAAVTILCSG